MSRRAAEALASWRENGRTGQVTCESSLARAAFADSAISGAFSHASAELLEKTCARAVQPLW